MSSLQSGSNFHRRSHVFEMREISQVGEARRFAALLAEAVQLSEVESGRIAIIVNELGSNLVKYGRNGRLILRMIDDQDQQQDQRRIQRGVEALSIDTGPGMQDIDSALRDGFTTGSSPGTGLGAVRRQATYFDIHSLPEKGTVVVAGVVSMEAPMTVETHGAVGVVCVPLQGERVSGDAWCVQQTDEGCMALVVDGLGHGIQANQAALEAVACFEENSRLPLDQVLNRIHGRLKSTRGGAVFMLRSEADQKVHFTGVGNIRALIQSFNRSKALISQNGTAGLQMRTIRVMSESWPDGVLILHSDGLTSRWNLEAYPGLLMRHPSIIAGVLYRDFARGTDDATVLVLRRPRA